MASDIGKAIKLLNDIASYVRKPSTLKGMGKANKSMIKKRTRLGFGVNDTGGKQVKLKITNKTKDIRKTVALSTETSPRKANLTRSGNMLDSLHSVVSTSEPSVTTKVSAANQDKANDLEKHGHKFLTLTKGELKRLIDLLVRGLTRNIK